VVTHGDGTTINAANPAKAGEEIVVFAVGLGLTTPGVKTGDSTPLTAPQLKRDVYIQFDFRPNATPTRPYQDSTFTFPLPYATPIFVGLTPNQIGLYQINVQLPTKFPPLQPCVSGPLIVSGISTIVGSNLTIDIGGLNSTGLTSVTSFDGASICMAPTS